MKIALLSGGFPPQFDGIGDHTWWLSQELANQGHEVVVFTSFVPERPKPAGVGVICCFEPEKPRTIQSLPDTLHAAGEFDWLIVQYNPFSFGPRGLAPWLLSALRKIKIPLALMFHETYVPLWPWRFTVMRLWQYPQFVLLVQMARVVFVSTGRWLPQVARWTRKHCSVLPVGSNLPRCELTRAEAKAKLGFPPETLLLGIFGFAHISKRIEWVGAAARRIYDRYPKTQLLSVGQPSDELLTACGPVPVHQHGFLPATEASLRLRAMDLFLAPFVDGISSRRTSVVSAFQHGVSICSTYQKHSDALLRDLVSPALSLTTCDAEGHFTESALEMARRNRQRANLGEDLAGFHDQNLSWPIIAQRLIAELRKKAIPEKGTRGAYVS
jgi:glycosyltransferase involved in cell wall biosynthesis